MVHAFTSSGLLPQQYKYFTGAAGVGTLSPFYIHESMLGCTYIVYYIYSRLYNGIFIYVHTAVYNRYKYLSIVRSVAQEMMKNAVEEVKNKDDVVGCLYIKL